MHTIVHVLVSHKSAHHSEPVWQKRADDVSDAVPPSKEKNHLQDDGGEGGDNDAKEGALARVVFLVVRVRLGAALA